MSKKCTPLWREEHFQVKMYKAHHVRTTFRSWDVEKVHTVVARSAFPSQNVQSTPCLDHFWKLRCRKSAGRCGPKRISKSKCAKHTMFGPLLEVEMSKKCTPLLREAHVQVKMYKTHHVRTTFGSWDVEKVHTVVARSTFRSQKWKKNQGTGHFWTLRCRFAWQAQGILHLAKSEQNWWFCSIYNYCHRYSPLHFTTLHYTQLHYTTSTTTTTLNYTTPITLHYPNYITLHYIIHYTTLATTTATTALHSTPLRYTTLHSITLHYATPATTTTTTLRYTTLITLHYTNYITLHYIKLYYTSSTTTTTIATIQLQLQLHYITLHHTTYSALHSTTLRYTTLHSITLNYSTLHYTTLTTTTTALHNTTLH